MISANLGHAAQVLSGPDDRAFCSHFGVSDAFDASALVVWIARRLHEFDDGVADLRTPVVAKKKAAPPRVAWTPQEKRHLREIAPRYVNGDGSGDFRGLFDAILASPDVCADFDPSHLDKGKLRDAYRYMLQREL